MLRVEFLERIREEWAPTQSLETPGKKCDKNDEEESSSVSSTSDTSSIHMEIYIDDIWEGTSLSTRTAPKALYKSRLLPYVGRNFALFVRGEFRNILRFPISRYPHSVPHLVCTGILLSSGARDWVKFGYSWGSINSILSLGRYSPQCLSCAGFGSNV